MSDQGFDYRQMSRYQQVVQDIDAVKDQHEAGDLDRVTAEFLLARYESELETLQETDSTDSPPTIGKRRWVGALVLIGVFTAVAVLAYGAIRPREGGFVTGDIGTGDVETGIDLDAVTNDQMEAVIASNPDIPQVAAMRLALADRYFDEGAFSDGLPHYLAALEGELDSVRRSRALARIGWMTFVSGRSDVAAEFLEDAIATDASYEEAHFFLGLLLLREGDPQSALVELEPLLDSPDLPKDLRVQLEAAITAAHELIAEKGAA